MDTKIVSSVSDSPPFGVRLNARLRASYCLPIHPSVFLTLMEMGKLPDASPADYAAVIATSRSLTAKLLATVNSSWFGLRHRVKKISQAVNLLGIANVRLLSVTHCLAAVHAAGDLSPEQLDHHRQVGLLKAVAAQWMAEHLDASVADEAFLIGLMQDMALPTMHTLHDSLYEPLLSGQDLSASKLCMREFQAFGMDHGEAARVLGETIGLPENVTRVLELHHDLAALGEPCESPALAHSVYFASLLPHSHVHWECFKAEEARQFLDQCLNLNSRQLSFENCIKEIQQQFEMLSRLVRGEDAKLLDLSDLMREATREIADTGAQIIGQLHSLMNGAVEADRELSARQIEALQLEEQSREDATTGVLNRFGLSQVGGLALHSLRQGGDSVLVLFADVDDFKHFNDRYGHKFGDQVLQHLANCIKQVCGPSAVVARYGGDEFVALVGGLHDGAAANDLAQNLLKQVMGEALKVEGNPVRVEMSIGGIFRKSVPEQSTLESLVTAADEQMYNAKFAGKNQVSLDVKP